MRVRSVTVIPGCAGSTDALSAVVGGDLVRQLAQPDDRPVGGAHVQLAGLDDRALDLDQRRVPAGQIVLSASTMRRLSVPRYWLRATISWPG